MRVSAELSWRRLVAALLLVTLLPAILAIAAFNYRSPDPTPGPSDYSPRPLTGSPLLAALEVRELQRSRRLTLAAPTLTAPRLMSPTFPDVLPTVVLAARATPYRLSELRQALPSAFGSVGGALLVRANIEVLSRSSLVIDAGQTPDVRLLSESDGFVSIISRGGSVTLQGTAQRKLHISSWDRQKGTVDKDPSDGRPFVLAYGGRMDVTRADIGYLGFGTGSTSGMAWRGDHSAPGLKGAHATGVVTASTLHHNWFGAYTYEARDMRWARNTFANNDAYGFDPHDLSNDFVVEYNTAHGNGRHGFIFSRGCDRNITRYNVSYDNRGHGFMVDDGRSEDTDYAEASRLASNNNQVIGNYAHDNDGSGVEIEGGSGNVVRDNRLERNHVGVRIKDRAAATIVGNEIADNRLYGVDVLAGSAKVAVEDNRISGGWASISIGKAGSATLTSNTVTGASAPLVVESRAVRNDRLTSKIGRFYNWNPLLVLWTSVLGVPLFVVGLRMLRSALRRRRLQGALS